MSEHQLATIGLTVIDDSGPEPVMTVRCWYVPPELIEGLAAKLTALYGHADEMIANPDTMAARAQQAAGEDGAVYMLNAEVPGHG